MPWAVELTSAQEIRVQLTGYLDQAEGVASARAVLIKLASVQADRSVDLVLEVPTMSGYHREARLAWQKTLWKHRGRINRMVVVGGNSVIRMGASVIAMSLGVPLLTLEVEASPELEAQMDPRVDVEEDAPAPRGRRRTGSMRYRTAGNPFGRLREASQPHC